MGQSSSLPAPDAASLTDWLQNGDGHLRGLWMGAGAGGREEAPKNNRFSVIWAFSKTLNRWHTWTSAVAIWGKFLL